MNTGGKIFLAIISVPVLLYVMQAVRMREVQRATQGAAGPAAAATASAAPLARRAPAQVQVQAQLQERLIQTSDYATFVSEVVTRADSGDADAQFALYTAFSYCEEGLRELAGGDRRQVPEEVAQRVHGRCDGLARAYANLDAESGRWLARAVQSGYPRALAEDALRELQLLSRSKMPAAKRAAQLQQVREQLARALRSNDPVVTWIAGEALPVLFPAHPRLERAYWTWKLAACDQGADCGPHATWVTHACQRRRDCRPGESGEDYIRRAAGDFAGLHADARSLAGDLRNGLFEPQDFDRLVTGSVPAAIGGETR
jgi:hypothetical protein